MHVFTLVLVDDGGAALEAAAHALTDAVPAGVDWWTAGGRFGDRPAAAGLLDGPVIAAAALRGGLPDELVPAAYVAGGRWSWRPQEQRRIPAWRRRLERRIAELDSGAAVVVFDVHC